MQYQVQPSNGLFPERLNRQVARRLERMDAQALAVQRDDQLRITRVQQATARGLVVVAQVSNLEASLVRAAPHAEGRLRAIADSGAISIAGIVADSGF